MGGQAGGWTGVCVGWEGIGQPWQVKGGRAMGRPQQAGLGHGVWVGVWVSGEEGEREGAVRSHWAIGRQLWQLQQAEAMAE